MSGNDELTTEAFRAFMLSLALAAQQTGPEFCQRFLRNLDHAIELGLQDLDSETDRAALLKVYRILAARMNSWDSALKPPH